MAATIKQLNKWEIKEINPLEKNSMNHTAARQQSPKTINQPESRNMSRIWKIGIIVLILAVLPFMPSLQLSNEYLMANQFEKIAVQKGDSFQGIASRYTDSLEKQKNLTVAIIEINGLSPDTVLHSGQKLIIPIVK